MRSSRTSKPAKSSEEPKNPAPVPDGTICPTDGHGMPQYRDQSRFHCDNGHGVGEAGEPIEDKPIDNRPARPKGRRKQPERPSGANASELLRSLDMGDLAGLVERAFDVDFAHDMSEVEGALSFGDADRVEFGRLRSALDEQCDIARIAHRLYCNAREAREVFEIDAKIVLASMRADATFRLQEEKAKGHRTKQITDDDVESMIAALHPDEWRDIARRRKRVELLCEHLKELADISKRRIGVLDTLTNTRR
jgi:hypothetical protein